MHRALLFAAALGGTLLAAGCNDDNNNNGTTTPSLPDSTGSGQDTTVSGAPATRLLTVFPHNNQSGYGTQAAITFTFDGAMDTTAGQYVDLHRGTGVDAPSFEVKCAWQGGHAVMSCTPITQLAPQTRFMVHIGGGLKNSAGQTITIPVGDSLGLMAAVRPDSLKHGPKPLGQEPAGWFSPNGTMGYVFFVTTGTTTATDSTALGGGGTGGMDSTGTGGTVTGT